VKVRHIRGMIEGDSGFLREMLSGDGRLTFLGCMINGLLLIGHKLL